MDTPARLTLGPKLWKRVPDCTPKFRIIYERLGEQKFKMIIGFKLSTLWNNNDKIRAEMRRLGLIGSKPSS